MGQSVIEINGKRYDASTGMVLNDAPHNPPRATARGNNIDGIVSTKNTPHVASPVTASKPLPKLGSRPVRDISMVHHHKPNKSKTLMRSAVKKPASNSIKPNSQSHVGSIIAPSNSYASAHIDRTVAANLTPKHHQVSHFAKNTSSAPLQPTVVDHLTVAQHSSQSPSPSHSTMTVNSTHTSTAATRFVDNQLAKSDSQLEVKPKKNKLHKRVGAKFKSFKFKSVASVSLAVLLIGGFLVYQNLPSISLVFANRAAGISADLPKGVPSSFAISKVTAGSGSVFLQYNSRVDDRKFTLTQVKADTTVKTLEESIARTSNNQYQTYQVSGITLFMSPNDRVDWIDGEMRYNIVGNTGFSPDQIALIASSL